MATKFTISSIFQAVDRITGPTKKMNKSVTGFSKSAQRSFKSMNTGLRSMRRLLTGAVAILATGAIAKGIKGLVTEASKIETVTTQFKTLTGSLETATALVDKMRVFAASTPLQFDTIGEGTKRLLAFGIEQKDVLGVMQTLGDAALGDAQKLNSLTRAYGKVSARGKTSMEEINMVIDAGVPIMDALSKRMGTTTEELTKMISKGEITSEVFQEAFKDMTSEGGQFYKGMEEQSKTTAGLFSTLKDNVTMVSASIGMALLPRVKELTGKLIGIAQKINEWIMRNKELVGQGIGNFLSNITSAVRQLISFITPLVKAIFKIAKELAVMFTETEVGAKIIKVLGSAFAALTEAVKIMWKVVKPILKLFLIVLEPILDIVNGIVKGIGAVADFLGKGNEGPSMADYGAAGRGRAGLVSPNSGVINAISESRNYTTNRSTVDVNFNNPPAGMAAEQKGKAPGINVDMGVPSGLSGMRW